KLRYDDLPKPEFTGIRVLSSEARMGVTCGCGQAHDPAGHPVFPVTLEELVPLIDWSPFFHAWELRGRYPAILQHEKHGEQARKLFADAQELLTRIIDQKLITARGVYGIFPANAVG